MQIRWQPAQPAFGPQLSEFPGEMLREWIAQGHPYVAELAAMRDVKYIDLPTGHWPQFTKPAQLGQAIVAAVDRA